MRVRGGEGRAAEFFFKYNYLSKKLNWGNFLSPISFESYTACMREIEKKNNKKSNKKIKEKKRKKEKKIEERKEEKKRKKTKNK